MDELNSSDCFPVGLRVLVVDDDPICLLIIERLLRSCLYQVTTCGQAVIALSLLREDSSRFDVVLSDVYMPEMDGFKLLELVQSEMDLPVIMMSANGETSNVMKGVSQGACDYLLKPVRLEELQNIWQHVVRKKQKTRRESDHSVNSKEHQRPKQIQISSKLEDASAVEASDICSPHRRRRGSLGDDSSNEEDEHLAAIKRQRVVWSEELHQKFISAINHLGLEQAVPKRILDLMNVPGLTRENVASHLQKYRLYLKRMTGSVNQQFTIPACLSPPGRFMHSYAFMKGLPVSQSIGPYPHNSLTNAQVGMCKTFKSESTDNEIMPIMKTGADPHIECNGSNGPMLAQYMSQNVQGKLTGAISSKHLKDTRSVSSGQPLSLPHHNSDVLLLQRNVTLPNSRNVVIHSLPHAVNNQLLGHKYDGPQHG